MLPDITKACFSRKVGGTKPELIARLKGLPPPPPKPKAPKKVKVVPKPSDDGAVLCELFEAVFLGDHL